ncbi:unnamed protein product [Rhizoctonia solani]|uniref:Uncharacterized protein n=1 Tax=Rhizoctonia solani TaxID=456999 RepID=A0A8H2X7V7_9AGAM|nr:unnamed protein product [Rhizoctonia solani]
MLGILIWTMLRRIHMSQNHHEAYFAIEHCSRISTMRLGSSTDVVAMRRVQLLLVVGNRILALDGWTAGSYVQKALDSDAAILGPASTKGQFVTGENSSIRMISGYYGQCLNFPYLNVKSAETSYKPLAFEAIGTSLDWSFNGTDNTLNTPKGFNTFVTCSDGALYLQTGTDFPSGNCTTTRLKSTPY